VIAHHGKVSSGDAGFDIRGSSAISGATDTNLGLYKNPDGSFDLKNEGRDIGEIDLRVSFDSERTWCWQNLGDAKDARRTEAENRITETIDLLGGNVEASVIANELELNRVTIQNHLKRMRDEGLVSFQVKGKKIFYSIPLTTPTIPTLHTTLQDLRIGTVRGKGIEASPTRCVGIVGDVNNNDEAPPYPTAPCHLCGCPDYWLREEPRQPAEWLCGRCHPKPGGIKNADR
jgi:DNA-binding transcriptional ArsR family regulator